MRFWCARLSGPAQRPHLWKQWGLVPDRTAQGRHDRGFDAQGWGKHPRPRGPTPLIEMEIVKALCALAALCSGAEAFAISPRVNFPASHLRATAPAQPTAYPLQAVPATVCARHASPSMGLFGLGWGEIGVLAVVGLLVFGPEKLAPFAKDIGASFPACASCLWCVALRVLPAGYRSQLGA